MTTDYFNLHKSSVVTGKSREKGTLRTSTESGLKDNPKDNERITKNPQEIYKSYY